MDDFALTLAGTGVLLLGLAKLLEVVNNWIKGRKTK